MAEGDFVLPVAFHFSVAVGGGAGDGEDGAFQEVSGLEVELGTETVAEGGENRFVHTLPKPATHPNLKLKRGLMDGSTPLAEWCKSTIENDLSEPIEPRDVTVSLLDADGSPVATWSAANAWPVKWVGAELNAMENKIAVETVELAYTTLRRTL